MGESGKKLSPQPSERALLTITAVGVVHCWLIGGVDPEDLRRLKEIQEEEGAAIDCFDLKLVHWHPSTEGEVIVHYTRGQQRIAYQLAPIVGKQIPLHLTLSKALKDSTSYAQHTTALQSLSTPAHQLTEETCFVDFKWPGKLALQRGRLVVKMLPGWSDSRLVSKRCLCLTDPVTQKLLARISSITAIYSTANAEIFIEGEARWQLNDREACPLCPRIMFQFLGESDGSSWELVKGLREAFEIINRPWSISTVTTAAAANVEMSLITTNRDQVKESGSAYVSAQITALLPDLFEAKPWCSLPFATAYSAYKMLCQERSVPVQEELAFCRAGKGMGFCLKDERGIVQERDLAKGIISESWYWYHVQLKS